MACAKGPPTLAAATPEMGVCCHLHMSPPPLCQENLSCRCTRQRAQVSAGVGKPSMDLQCASGCTRSTARATARLRNS